MVDNVDNRFARGDHIVDDKDALVFKRSADIFVLNDRVLAVDYASVVASFIAHTHVKTENVGVINRSFHGAGVGADDRPIVFEYVVAFVLYKAFEHRISRENIFKGGGRNSVADSRIVCVESENAVDAKLLKLFKRHCAVKRFSALSFVLARRIKQRHKNGDPVGFSVDCRKNTLDIAEVIVRAHVVFVAVKIIGAGIIADIAKDIYISPSYGIADLDFAFTVVEPYFLDRNDVTFTVFFIPQLMDELVYFNAELFTAFQDDKTHLSVINILRHNNYTLLEIIFI